MELTDGDRIRGLLARYCRLIDAGDFAGVGALFARATLRDESGAVVAAGADQVRALYESTTRRHSDGTPRTQHLVLNTAFVEAAPGEDQGSGSPPAVAESTYVVLQATDALVLQPIITGHYRDTFARDDAVEFGWYFTERRFGVGLVGNLGEHLDIDLKENR